jgi:hypothetical protein
MLTVGVFTAATAGVPTARITSGLRSANSLAKIGT